MVLEAEQLKIKEASDWVMDGLMVLCFIDGTFWLSSHMVENSKGRNSLRQIVKARTSSMRVRTL